MANKSGIVKTAKTTVEGASEDASLPDPSQTARRFLLVCLIAAVVVALIANAAGWTNKPFVPAQGNEANFALFAGFYAAAQVIERLMELVSPLLPFWKLPSDVKGDKKAELAQTKADRAKAVMGIATLAGVATSAGLGLYFLTAIGMHVTRFVDIAVTAVVIGAGTKPLHDLISNIQNKNNPTSGTESGQGSETAGGQ